MYAIRRSVLIVLLFLTLAMQLLFIFFTQAKAAFLTNIFLNSSILALFIFGVVYNGYLFWQLKNDATWFDFFEKARDHESKIHQPKLLKPLQQLFKNSKPSAFLLQSIFGSVQHRFDESRDLNKYITGLLIFLGLLGTFWGLSHTVTSISNVISNIDLKTGDIQDAFDTLRAGLHAPLMGMGTAFSSSMFGLLSSLIIGFVDAQYGKSIQSFFYHMEERVQLGASASGEGMMGTQTYAQSVLEQTAESMQLLGKQLQRSDENRQQFLKNMVDITEKLNLLVDQQHQQLSAIQALGQNQFNVQQILTRQAETNTESVKYWRNLDAQLSKLLENISINHNQLSRELCEEIRTVARILAALGSGKQKS